MPKATGINEGRFKDLILYASKQLADDPAFGSTKLNKVLFFSDFEAYRTLGSSITGAEYQKNHYGPTARLYVPLVDQMLGHAFVRIEKRFVGGHAQDVLTPLVEPNMKQFSTAELEIVDRIIAEMRTFTNTEASDLSHERSPGWQLLELGDTIPYETALIDTEPPSNADVAYFRQLHGIPA